MCARNESEPVVTLTREEARMVYQALGGGWSPTNRCPYCSFNPTSRSDYCWWHEPALSKDADALRERIKETVTNWPR